MDKELKSYTLEELYEKFLPHNSEHKSKFTFYQSPVTFEYISEAFNTYHYDAIGWRAFGDKELKNIQTREEFFA